MKSLILFLIIAFTVFAAGCAGSTSNTAGNTRRTSNTNTTVSTNTGSTPATSVTPFDTSNVPTDRADYKKNGKKSSNTSSNVDFNGLKSRVSPVPTPAATPLPASVEKKEEGLFSFPPPKATDATEIKPEQLDAQAEQTTLAQISEKLSAGLENAGYRENTYSYFWNERDEFAIVTAMERVNADGSNFTNNRWVEDDSLPKAESLTEYFRFLIEGKKVYYRVYAFIVTARRTRQSFLKGASPEYVTALNWKNKGESQLGDGSQTTVIESALWTDKHKCYALVYLFVNHTSLDTPKSVDSLVKNERRLQEDLNKEAAVHLKNTNLNFGG